MLYNIHAQGSAVQGDPEGLGLGLVDLIWGVPTAGGPLLWLLTARAE